MWSFRARRILFGALVAAVALPSAALTVLSLLSNRPQGLRVREGRLSPCPDKPNCVSSQADDPRHAIAPIRFKGPADAALERLRTVLQELSRTSIVTDQPPYIHAEAHSRVFRFIDDMEFLVDSDQSVIHFRSAARVGYSDFGVNRKRAESIRKAFEALDGADGE